MKYLALALTVLASVNVFSQKLDVTAGKTSNVGQVKVYSIEMEWEGMEVRQIGTEEDIKQKTIDKFDAEAEGSGDDWLAEWEEKKAKTYPSKFTRSFNKPLIKHGVMIATRSYEGEIDGKIVVKTESIHLGETKKRSFEEALVTALVSFYNDSDDLLFQMRVTDAPGAPSGSEWRNSTEWYAIFERLREGYSKLGKEVGIYIYEKEYK